LTSRLVTFVIWGVLVGGLALCTVWALVQRSATSIDTLVRSVLQHAVPRLALLLGWMWLGWHLFAR
jgi:hypothetical protein